MLLQAPTHHNGFVVGPGKTSSARAYPLLLRIIASITLEVLLETLSNSRAFRDRAAYRPCGLDTFSKLQDRRNRAPAAFGNRTRRRTSRHPGRVRQKPRALPILLCTCAAGDSGAFQECR